MINVLFAGNDGVFDGILTCMLSIFLRTTTKEPFTFYIFTMDVSHIKSSTISRVMSTYKCVIIIYLVASSPIQSSVLPKSTTGSRIAFSWTCFGWGLHGPLPLPATR